MAPIPLSQIPTIAESYTSNELQPSSQLVASATSRFNHKISLIRVDITLLGVDAIVNAANRSLLGGGGVDGAIHRAAGHGLYDECKTLGGCATGSAKITDAYRLPCKKVVHAVGPVYDLEREKEEGRERRLLQGCYTTSLDLAVEHGCRSIAFSALSTGIYGYPSRAAAGAAVGAVKGWFEEDAERAEKIDRVIFCQFMEKDQLAYEELIPRIFPPAGQVEADADESMADESYPVVGGINGAEASGEATGPHTADEDDQNNAHGGDSMLLENSSTAGKHQDYGPTAKADDDTPLPELPDVPTAEPKQEGQPEAKKLKLDHSNEKGG